MRRGQLNQKNLSTHPSRRAQNPEKPKKPLEEQCLSYEVQNISKSKSNVRKNLNQNHPRGEVERGKKKKSELKNIDENPEKLKTTREKYF